MGFETRLSLRQLRAFVAVYRLGKLSEAAQRLSVTPSAISVLIRQIEASTGVRLFDRHARALEPTSAAHGAIGQAERILAEVDMWGSSLRGLRDRAHGLVQLAATPAVGAALLPPVIRKFVRKYPRIQVMLNDCAPDQFVPLILSEQVEFGIGTPSSDSPGGFDADLLVDDCLCVICPRDHALARQAQVRWSQLKNLPIIAGTPGYSALRRLADAAAARAGIELRVVNQVNFLVSAMWMVASGLGLAIFPAALVDAEHHPRLVARPLTAPRVTRGISVVTKHGRSVSPASESFIELLRDEMRTRAVDSAPAAPRAARRSRAA